MGDRGRYVECDARAVVAFWREHMQPAVPSPPDGPHLPDHPALLVPPRRDRDVTATGRAVAALFGDDGTCPPADPPDGRWSGTVWVPAQSGPMVLDWHRSGPRSVPT